MGYEMKGTLDKDYGLNYKGELEWVDIKVYALSDRLVFESQLNGWKYEIVGMSVDELDDEIAELGDSDFIDELLTMVGEMGGGLWPDNPDGTSTTYEFDRDSGVLTVVER